ncbi:TetR/AcrR family transcriptional regulator [Phytoactinopolyspora mesophila]|uniref:TetR family transcriptional regulator n=1 Tax=Phytoactinopolyspora mesophila TaxID=2650750 RepID=A0A7K3M7N4_9ACTN|nr:TetR/AcrR family transcriptional regulator [Phytoactinopolyspora mesophila]NDL58952.1 TetR family transcriptional regulator [Phytoactinopolyspora mesophila]
MGNREALLAGARHCLMEKGWGRTTVRDIAAAAGGISHAAIGYHFGSKDALLNAALVEAMDEWGDQIWGTMSGSGDTEDMWAAVVDSFAENRALFAASFELLMQAQRSPELQRYLATAQEQGRRGLAARLTGVDESEVPDATVRTLGAVQMALLNGVLTQWLSDPETAPSGAEVAAGLRALAEATSGPENKQTARHRPYRATAANNKEDEP